MRQRIIYKPIIFACVSLVGLHANTLAPALANNPASIQSYFNQQKPKGSETFTTFFMTIYDIALWTEHPTWDFNQKSAIRLDYKRDVSKEKIMHYSMGAMGYVVDDEAKLVQYKNVLQPFIKDVKEGDSFTFVYLPNRGIEFFYNDQSLGVCPNQGFAKTFMNIWLHPKTEYPGVREALLGLKK